MESLRSDKKQKDIDTELTKLKKLSKAKVYNQYTERIKSGTYRTDRKLFSNDKATLLKQQTNHTKSIGKVKYNITKRIKYNTKLLNLMNNNTNVE